MRTKCHLDLLADRVHRKNTSSLFHGSTVEGILLALGAVIVRLYSTDRLMQIMP